VTLAVCLALKPGFLLLDEPTSALDHEAAIKVERLLRESKAACIWVTHEDAQVGRVGGRALQLPLGTQVLQSRSYWHCC
jgi:ABC-type phosphate transport system ATPase subunit